LLSGEIYTSEKEGCDSSGDGTEAKPFKTIIQAMRHAGKEPFPPIYVDAKPDPTAAEGQGDGKVPVKKIQQIYSVKSLSTVPFSSCTASLCIIQNRC
jgi:asparaginyl-tRNA synthetase